MADKENKVGCAEVFVGGGVVLGTITLACFWAGDMRESGEAKKAVFRIEKNLKDKERLAAEQLKEKVGELVESGVLYPVGEEPDVKWEIKVGNRTYVAGEDGYFTQKNSRVFIKYDINQILDMRQALLEKGQGVEKLP